jgi:hypothetical protein
MSCLKILLPAALFLHVAFGNTIFAAAKIEESIVGPARPDALYIVSPAGVRLATVTMKGPSHLVVVDGVEGPLFDQMLQINGQPFYRPGSGMSTVGHLPPVVFSADGKRHAYCARRGDDVVVVVDGKEFARLPNTVNILNYGALAFSPGGKHLYYVTSDTSTGYRLVVNGQPGPALGSPPSAIVFSADDSRYAYVAARRENRDDHLLIVDGKEANAAGSRPATYEQLAFTSDDKLVCVAKTKDGAALLINGTPATKAAAIEKVVASGVGPRVAALLKRPDNSTVLWLDGKEVAGSEGVADLIFSPDGKRYAALCKRPGQNFPQWIVSDGKKHQEFQRIVEKQANSTERAILFTSDSSKLVYLGSSGDKIFVVINGEVSDRGFRSGTAWKMVLSQEGAHVAFTGQADTDTHQQRTIVVDDKVHAAPGTLRWDSFLFSPDGSRFAWSVSRVSPDYLFLDGTEQGYNNARVVFAPNSRHAAVFGQHVKSNQFGLFMDDTLVHDGRKQGAILDYHGFTPDSRHFYWTSRQTAGPQRIKWTLHLDGSPALEIERASNVARTFAGTPYFRGGVTTFDKIPFAWEMDERGTLTFLEDAGDAIKRFRVTPSSETNVSAMIAAAQAASAPTPAAPPARKTKAR